MNKKSVGIESPTDFFIETLLISILFVFLHTQRVAKKA